MLILARKVETNANLLKCQCRALEKHAHRPAWHLDATFYESRDDIPAL